MANAARIPFKKTDLAVRLCFPLSAQLPPRGLSVPPWTILPACSVNTDETPARFSSRLPSCGASRYKALFPLLTKAQKQKALARLRLGN